MQTIKTRPTGCETTELYRAAATLLFLGQQYSPDVWVHSLCVATKGRLKKVRGC